MTSTLHARIYQGRAEELALSLDRVTGTVPPELEGTLLRNGPGLLELGDDHLNFFDGHGLVAGVTFSGGRATMRARFVRTPLYEQESKARRIVTRHVFTNHPSRWRNLLAVKLQNTAAHDVYAWGEGDALRVVAGNDPGHFALDPRTLETRGPERWSEAAPAGCEMGPMPSLDANTGHLVGFVKQPGLSDRVRFVELDGAFRVVRESAWHGLGRGGTVVHDQRASARFYVATLQAYELSLPAALWGRSTLFGSFRIPNGGTASLVVVPRDGGPGVQVPLPGPFPIAFHIVNAFDDGPNLVVDVVAYDGAIGFERAMAAEGRARLGIGDGQGALPIPMRFVVDPAAGVVIDRRRLGDVVAEAPEVADSVMGKPYRYAYFPSLGPGEAPPDRGAYFHYGSLVKLDVETGAATRWSAGNAVVSPCAFAPRPGGASEDDGWILAWLVREEGAAVVVLDARDVARGPIATLEVGAHLPGVSHVRWAPTVRLAV